ncbi:MAG: hypothetical protein K0S55_1026 [Clostridia bacterium]|nr:hypothetical protein [Clostridia bacterium]
MNSKQIIKNVISFSSPLRIGWDFHAAPGSDFAHVSAIRLYNEKYNGKYQWNRDAADLSVVGSFKGEVHRDIFGNIYGRLDDKTKGECLKGILQDDWSLLEDFDFPRYDNSFEEEARKNISLHSEKYTVSSIISPFSFVRDARRMDNLLMDAVLEEENLLELMVRVREQCIFQTIKVGITGCNAIVMYDDWGTQNALLMSPFHWRRFFKPTYKAICDTAHEYDMKVFLHSCGYIYEIIEDFIEIGIDALQLDQPELMGVDRLSSEFGGKIAFWCPVDIQKIMPTGNKELIEENARNMIKKLNSFGGGFIAKDYPQWDAIGVDEKWADWARKIFEKGI